MSISSIHLSIHPIIYWIFKTHCGWELILRSQCRCLFQSVQLVFGQGGCPYSLSALWEFYSKTSNLINDDHIDISNLPSETWSEPSRVEQCGGVELDHIAQWWFLVKWTLFMLDSFVTEASGCGGKIIKSQVSL